MGIPIRKSRKTSVHLLFSKGWAIALELPFSQ